jgi:hypothetical protein
MKLVVVTDQDADIRNSDLLKLIQETDQRNAACFFQSLVKYSQIVKVGRCRCVFVCVLAIILTGIGALSRAKCSAVPLVPSRTGEEGDDTKVRRIGIRSFLVPEHV